MHFLVFLQWVFSGRLVFGERKFSADWFSGREKFSGDMRSIGMRGVSEGNLFWFLELIGALKLFRMVFTMCHVCLSGELLWRFEDLLHAHPQFGNILCGALLPSVMIESLRRCSANGERLNLRGGAMHCFCL